jgi:hypothetical protein
MKQLTLSASTIVVTFQTVHLLSEMHECVYNARHSKRDARLLFLSR